MKLLILPLALLCACYAQENAPSGDCPDYWKDVYQTCFDAYAMDKICPERLEELCTSKEDFRELFNWECSEYTHTWCDEYDFNEFWEEVIPVCKSM